MKDVFVSYRRTDSATIVGRIIDRLESRFGRDRIFRDLDTIDYGQDFAEVISQSLEQSRALLVVIGPEWLSTQNETGERRLDSPGDFVRLEVARALQEGIHTIPVLVAGARMPSPRDLPDALKPLANLAAAQVRDDPDFDRDIERLCVSIGRRLKNPLLRRIPRVTIPLALVLAALAVVGVFHDDWFSRPEFAAQQVATSIPPETFVEIALSDDWNRSYDTVKKFQKLPAIMKERLADALIAKLASSSGIERLQILSFFRGHLHMRNLPPQSLLRLCEQLRLMTESHALSNQELETTAGIFHALPAHPGIEVQACAADVLLTLSAHSDDEVRSTAVRRLSKAHDSKGSKAINDRVFTRLMDVWNAEAEVPTIRANALASLHGCYGIDANQREAVSIALTEALESGVPEYRHATFWVLGGLTFGFDPSPSYRERILQGCIDTIQSQRDIPGSWVITTFDKLPGRLPAEVEAKLETIRAEEKALRDEMRRHELLRRSTEGEAADH